MAQKIENLNSPLFSTYILAGCDVMERPVPETTPRKYIGGMTTLCLPSPWTNGTQGQSCGPDCLYCFKGEFAPLPTWGEGGSCERNTLHIYGDYGIHNYAKILYDAGFDHNFEIVYGADHFRAILDLVYADIITCNPKLVEAFTFFTAWIIAESIGLTEDCKTVLDKIKKMEPFLPEERKCLLKKWIKEEEKNIETGFIF